MEIKKVRYVVGKQEKLGFYVKAKQGYREIKIVGEFLDFDRDKVIMSDVYFDELKGEFKDE